MLKKVIIAIFIINVGFILLGLFYEWIKSINRRKRGDEFEDTVAGKLKRIKGGYIVRNVLFYKLGMTTRELKKQRYDVDKELLAKETETDIVFVNKKGIFSIECKSFLDKDERHPITGSLNTAIWRKRKENMPSYEFQNPFNQNYKHLKALSEHGFGRAYNIVTTNAPFEFNYCGVGRNSSDSPYVSMLRNNDEKMALIRVNGLSNGIKLFIKDIEDLPDVYTEEEVKTIYEKLKTFEASKAERKVHALAKEILSYRT